MSNVEYKWPFLIIPAIFSSNHNVYMSRGPQPGNFSDVRREESLFVVTELLVCAVISFICAANIQKIGPNARIKTTFVGHILLFAVCCNQIRSACARKKQTCSSHKINLCSREKENQARAFLYFDCS